jgi:hypothetical protein
MTTLLDAWNDATTPSVKPYEPHARILTRFDEYVGEPLADLFGGFIGLAAVLFLLAVTGFLFYIPVHFLIKFW